MQWCQNGIVDKPNCADSHSYRQQCGSFQKLPLYQIIGVHQLDIVDAGHRPGLDERFDGRFNDGGSAFTGSDELLWPHSFS